ncbi:MAG: fused MFS/spermidine synthase [Maricaulaceae bacterium]|jgi:hypothetical protein
MKYAALGFIFALGILSMGLQLLASRLLAPWFGTSIIVWGFLIATFLAAFALGSFLGGVISHIESARRWRALIAVAAVNSLSLAFLAFAGRMAVDALDAAVPNIYTATAIACVGLFMIPVITTSAWLPVVIQLISKRAEDAGFSAGLAYAVSTAGNIAGVLGTAFLLIPNFPVSQLFIAWWASASLLLAWFISAQRR